MNAKLALMEYRTGTPIDQLAKRYGLTKKTVYNRLVNANGGRSLTGRTRAPKLGICASKTLRDATINNNGKHTYRTIGEVLGLSHSTVQRIYSQAA